MAKKSNAHSTALATTDPPPEAAAVNKVFEWIISGHSEHHVLQSINEELGGQPARPLIDAAWLRICETGDAPVSGIIAWAMEATRLTYQRMMDTADYTGALRAIKQVVDLAERRPIPMDDDGGAE